MKLTSSTLLLALFSLPALACANAKSSFFGGDGGAEGGTIAVDGGKSDGGAATGSDCPGFCAYAAEKGIACEDTAKCNTACKASKKAATTADCDDEWQALIDCAMGPGTGTKKPLITCTSTGKTDVANCSSPKSALETCISAVPPVEEDSGPPPSSCTLSEPIDSVAACNTCAESNCCTEWNACTASTACGDFYACVGACSQNDATCVTTCRTNFPAGNTIAMAAIGCTQTACATPCGL